ncbi:MAG: hypothetical protein OEN50_18205, partial [Deltaproteobacteria bacterium]|nr:hypothetical protein [Deltaproteobacteria bacterium]
MNAISKSSKSGGCGCNCGGQAALCACGDVGCATCRNQGFVRPRFFAGQLLTEEDLQKLIEYVVAKNRLHNQRLWGDGVVCGLEVSCNPCGGGTVRVNPGYALDCCGNDLVLECPQDLDINAMVRDLKRNLLGGIDCGDPCPPLKKKELAGAEDPFSIASSNPSTGTSILVSPDSNVGLEENEAVPKDTTRHYCLYLRYCENLTDPVSPYATDEGCSYQSCQPTRVSEGVTFELRCDDGCGHQTDIRDRLCECIGDLDSAFRTTQYSNSFQAATRLLAPVENVVLTDESKAAENFLSSVDVLWEVHRPRRPSTKSQPTTAEQPSNEMLLAKQLPDVKIEINVDEFEGRLSEVHTAAAHLAGYRLTLPEPAIEPKEVDDALKFSLKKFHDVATRLKELVNDVPAPNLARGYYTAALQNTIGLAKNNILDKTRLKQIAKGLLLTSEDVQSSGAATAAMKEELLNRLDRSPRLSDCQLRFDVEAIRIPGSDARVTEWLNTFRQLHSAWVRYLKDCVCAAFNPPCAPCEDSAVLLACLEVKDCHVVEICNLKRKFVLSGSTLRYWFPPLNSLGEALEKLCCPDPICIEKEEDRATGKPSNVLGTLSKNQAIKKTPGRINFSIFNFLCEPRKKEAYALQRFRTRGLGMTTLPFGQNQPMSDTLRSIEAEILRWTGMPGLLLGQPVDFSSRIRDVAGAMKDESLTMLAAEAIKANPGL